MYSTHVDEMSVKYEHR